MERQGGGKIHILKNNNFLLYLKSNKILFLFNVQNIVCAWGRINNLKKNHVNINIINIFSDCRYLFLKYGCAL